MSDASHPAVLQLDANAFAGNPPMLRTIVAYKGDRNYEVQLLWSPLGEIEQKGEKRVGEVEVGKLEFHGWRSSVRACLRVRIPATQTRTHWSLRHAS